MSQNPFDFMQNFMQQDSFGKVMKVMPNVDLTSLTNMVKNNSDAITSTNQIASESIQSIMKRGAEGLQKNATDMFNSMKDAVSAGDVEQIAACQQKYIKSTLENNINNTKEVLDIASKSSMEILDTIGKNVSDAMGKSMPKAKKA